MGGGSAGAASWPSYMQGVHHNLLNLGAVGDPGPDVSVVEEINNMYGNSPFTGQTAYNPDSALGIAAGRIGQYETLVQAMSYTSDFSSALAAVDAVIPLGTVVLDEVTVDTSRINDAIVAYDNELKDRLESSTLPEFKAGMLNINAINSSSFVIGEAVLRAFEARDVAKYSADLRLKLETQNDELNTRFKLQRRELDAKMYIQRQEMIKFYTVEILANLMRQTQFLENVAKIDVEFQRMKIIAKNDQLQEQLSIDEHEAKWNLDLFQYAFAALGSISGGGAGHQALKKPAKSFGGLAAANASGAAMGASIPGAGWYGAVAGSLVGMGLYALQ